VQGSSSFRDLVHRLRVVGVLFVGVLAGTIILWTIVSATARVADFDLRHSLWPTGIALPLLFADAWAIRNSRLCPLGTRRQAAKSLMYRGYTSDVVGFAWGFDVGLGVTTYRVTTGVWLIIALAIGHVITPSVLYIYCAAFGLAILTVALAPVHSTTEERPDAVLVRLVKVAERRRWAQTMYLCVVPVCVLVLGAAS
jgi:hypothetical protein